MSQPEEKSTHTQQVLLENLGRVAYTLDKAYLPCLKNAYTSVPPKETFQLETSDAANENILLPLEDNKLEEYYARRIRAVSVKRIVIDKDEQIADRFKNIISLCGGIEHTLAVIFKRTVQGTEMLFVLKNSAEDAQNSDMKDNIRLLEESICGNFPGTELGGFTYSKDLLNQMDFDKAESVSITSGIPSEKSEKFISQGIEKLLNGVVPQSKEENYTVILLAEPISALEIRNILNGYEELATAIAPYAQYQFQSGTSKTDTRGEMQSLAHGTSISDSISKTHSINIGLSTGINAGVNAGLSAIVANIGANLGGYLGLNLGYGYSWGKTKTTGTSDTETTGTNMSVSVGASENTTYTYKSYTVSNILKKLETTIERIDRSKADGLWKSAVYVLSESPNSTLKAANYLRSIFQGDESYIEPSFVQTWTKNKSSDDFDQIIKYIKCFRHPIFKNSSDGSMVLPTLNVSTAELANIFAFPRKSVTGLPVIECAEFGRNISTYDETEDGESLHLGRIFHMNRAENTNVLLNKNSLAAHTFITGSTKAGKSNTVYQILDRARKCGVKFLVVEPAKGEYKKVFGNDKDVYVYGTNKAKTPLLRIDPFSFPNDVHVLEHLDRLIEIFNVCWPMYAAMPAVLKNAVEKAYEDCGWDLTESTNEFGENLFPNFADVARNIKQIIDSSEYDTENKGAYKGSLLTRLNSLTNGINGLIFQSDEITAEELFDKNVIVDLSLVGSMETKSLIMGMLVLKLQEYRMSGDEMNAELRHLTVLEEAHNLLKHTSTEQSTEVGNLLGKSVEMLSNAIAEMRTYGEGFIIADQAPGLLDMSVIRNTNTKIIMRLPDQSDRELVGKAANLNENQISELAKLPCGVAAVYQNEWIQPVLCKVEKYEYSESYTPPKVVKKNRIDITKRARIMELLSGRIDMDREALLREIDPIMREMKIASSVRVSVLRIVDNMPARLNDIAPIASALFPEVFRAVADSYRSTKETRRWTEAALSVLNEVTDHQIKVMIIQSVITDYTCNVLGKGNELLRWKEGEKVI